MTATVQLPVSLCQQPFGREAPGRQDHGATISDNRAAAHSMARLPDRHRYIILPRDFSARAASAADSTFLTSSGGGSTALKPIESIHISRAQPRV